MHKHNRRVFLRPSHIFSSFALTLCIVPDFLLNGFMLIYAHCGPCFLHFISALHLVIICNFIHMNEAKSSIIFSCAIGYTFDLERDNSQYSKLIMSFSYNLISLVHMYVLNAQLSF